MKQKVNLQDGVLLELKYYILKRSRNLKVAFFFWSGWEHQVLGRTKCLGSTMVSRYLSIIVSILRFG
jgi:hypothetical protein